MTTSRREGSTEATQEGLDPVAGTHAPPRKRRDRSHDDPLAEAGAEPDLAPPVSDRLLDDRDRQQSAERKKPGPKPPEAPPATPVAPPPTAPPPSDPE